MEGAKIRFMMIEADNVSAETISQIIQTIAQKSAPPLPPPTPTPPVRLASASVPAPILPSPTRKPLPAPDKTPASKPRKNGAFFTSPQHPGKTFTVNQAADLAGVKPCSVYGAVKSGRPIKGITFEKNASGIIPDYTEYHGTTRGQADGDMMPLNAQRNSAYDPPAPKDLQREL